MASGRASIVIPGGSEARAVEDAGRIAEDAGKVAVDAGKAVEKNVVKVAEKDVVKGAEISGVKTEVQTDVREVIPMSGDIPSSDLTASINGGGEVTKGGGEVFTNETEAYKRLWKNSLDSKGDFYKENFAWITDDGVMVLPNKGYDFEGNYFENTIDEANPWVNKVKGNSVYLNNKKYNIIGSIHTHPNNIAIEAANSADWSKTVFGPVFALTKKNLFGVYKVGGEAFNIPTMNASLLLNGKIGLINTIKGIK